MKIGNLLVILQIWNTILGLTIFIGPIFLVIWLYNKFKNKRNNRLQLILGLMLSLVGISFYLYYGYFLPMATI